MNENVVYTDVIYTLEEIKKLAMPILRKYNITEAYIFGSYARGEATPTSDIDFLINNGNIEDLLEFAGLYLDLEEVLLKRVDIVFIDALKDNRFTKNIINERVGLLHGYQ